MIAFMIISALCLLVGKTTHLSENATPRAQDQIHEINTVTENQITPIDKTLGYMHCITSIIQINSTDSGLLVISEGIDENCLSRVAHKKIREVEQNIDHSKFISLRPSDIAVKTEKRQSKFGNISYQSFSVYTHNWACGEKCQFQNIEYAHYNNKYYFLFDFDGSWVITNLIRSDILHFKRNKYTHTENIIIHLQENNNWFEIKGDLKFLDDSFIVRKKDYWPESGTFWYDQELSYNRSLITLRDIVDGNCYSRESFHAKIRELMKKSNKENLCILM